MMSSKCQECGHHQVDVPCLECVRLQARIEMIISTFKLHDCWDETKGLGDNICVAVAALRIAKDEGPQLYVKALDDV